MTDEIMMDRSGSDDRVLRRCQDNAHVDDHCGVL